MSKKLNHRAMLLVGILALLFLSIVYITAPFNGSLFASPILQKSWFRQSEESLESSNNNVRSGSSQQNKSSNDVDREGKSPIADDQCILPRTSNFSQVMKPLKRHEDASFIMPRYPTKRALLNERLLEDETLFTFIHVNKAGGTLIKEEVFKPASISRKWDGAGWGSTIGWNQLIKRCPSSGVSHVSVAEEALACGNVVGLSSCGPVGGGSCPLRLVWGTHAMGMCQLYPNKPCVMAIVLRHPVERAISQYNYVCVEGKEGRKKWLESWKQENRCPLSLLQFLETDLTSRTFLMDHLTRAADPVCGVENALKNLRHPCMRFLLLDNLGDGLARLAKVWGPAMRPYLEKAAAKSKQKVNQSNYPARIKVQMENPEILARLRELLKLDIEFYERAVEYYEKQWESPLESCTEISS